MKLQRQHAALSSGWNMVPILNVILLLVFFLLLSTPFVLHPVITVDPPRGISTSGAPSSRMLPHVPLVPARHRWLALVLVPAAMLPFRGFYVLRLDVVPPAVASVHPPHLVLHPASRRPSPGSHSRVSRLEGPSVLIVLLDKWEA